MKSHLKYLRYILRHKYFVFIECCKLGIPWQGMIHDLSKFSPAEWTAYVHKFFGGPWPKALEIHGDRRNSISWFQENVDSAFDRAWQHHQDHNPHHWEHWSITGGVIVDGNSIHEGIQIPHNYILEMFADWTAMSKAKGEPNCRKWYQQNRSSIVLHPASRQTLETMIFSEVLKCKPRR